MAKRARLESGRAVGSAVRPPSRTELDPAVACALCQALAGDGSCADGPAGKGLSAHILPTSATMVGVCLTVLSIGHLGQSTELHLLVDKLLAVDALVFLASAFASFISMRSHRSGARDEARAEWIFITGLGLLAMLAVILPFVTHHLTQA